MLKYSTKIYGKIFININLAIQKYLSYKDVNIFLVKKLKFLNMFLNLQNQRKVVGKTILCTGTQTK